MLCKLHAGQGAVCRHPRDGAAAGAGGATRCGGSSGGARSPVAGSETLAMGRGQVGMQSQVSCVSRLYCRLVLTNWAPSTWQAAAGAKDVRGGG